jgi:thiol-disulfide isomerase/thioredoxin
MGVLGAAVALTAAIGGLNLLLLYGVIRRLRTHSELLASLSGPATDGPALHAHVAPFAVSTVDGRELSHAALHEDTLVGFFAPDCAPCEELLPRFIEQAQGTPRVVAVVAEGPGEDGYVARLQPVATVVGGAGAAQLAAAFGVRGFPTLCRVDGDGAIRQLPQEVLA